MKSIQIITKTILTATSIFILASCFDHLDRFPENETTAKEVFSTFDGYKGALAKIYASFALTGNQGPAGQPDVAGLDEGQNADFLRNWFNHQEMPTDQAHCIWTDVGIAQLNNINFASDASNGRFTVGLYSRCLMQIMYVNEFLRNSSDLGSGKGFTSQQTEEIRYFRAEARFMRAFSWWVLLDAFGNLPFMDESSNLSDLPKQIKRVDLFNYIETELLDLTNNNLLKAARTNEYGRADIAAGNALLARLYLNAEIYTGTQRWNDALTHAKKVIDAGFTLKANYEELFFADNHLDNNETILAITYDGRYTRNYGGTTFLINAPGQSAYQNTYRETVIHWGISNDDRFGWAGYRVRKQFVDKFATNDKRFLFVGEEPEIGSNPTVYRSGLATYKYRNIKRGSTVENPIFGDDPRGEYSDVDFPLFRLAEMYLIFAEAVTRGASGGTMSEAAGYFNLLRERAFGNNTNNVATLTAQDVLDERARELYWECHRRTDLIRFGQFTTDAYIWEWKGGVQEGRAIGNHFNLFPIPDPDRNANPNLEQNHGY